MCDLKVGGEGLGGAIRQTQLTKFLNPLKSCVEVVVPHSHYFLDFGFKFYRSQLLPEHCSYSTLLYHYFLDLCKLYWSLLLPGHSSYSTLLYHYFVDFCYESYWTPLLCCYFLDSVTTTYYFVDFGKKVPLPQCYFYYLPTNHVFSNWCLFLLLVSL